MATTQGKRCEQRPVNFNEGVASTGNFLTYGGDTGSLNTILAFNTTIGANSLFISTMGNLVTVDDDCQDCVGIGDQVRIWNGSQAVNVIGSHMVVGAAATRASGSLENAGPGQFVNNDYIAFPDGAGGTINVELEVGGGFVPTPTMFTADIRLSVTAEDVSNVIANAVFANTTLQDLGGGAQGIGWVRNYAYSTPGVVGNGQQITPHVSNAGAAALGSTFGGGAPSSVSNSTAIGDNITIVNNSDKSVLIGTTLTMGTENNYTVVIGAQSTLAQSAFWTTAVGTLNTIGFGSPACVVVGRQLTVGDHAFNAILFGAASSIGNFSPNSIVMGTATTVGINSTDSMVMGNQASIGTNAGFNQAIGAGAVIGDNTQNSIILGRNSTIGTNNNLSCIVGAGSSIGNLCGNCLAMIGGTVNASSTAAMAIGPLSNATGSYAIALGASAVAGANTMIVGDNVSPTTAIHQFAVRGYNSVVLDTISAIDNPAVSGETGLTLTYYDGATVTNKTLKASTLGALPPGSLTIYIDP